VSATTHPRVDTKHPSALHHVAAAVRLNPREVKQAISQVNGFNAKLAVLITKLVGSMACAYAFTVLALISLPAILIQAHVITPNDVPKFFTKPGLILIVAWIAQTFLQLVLLSIIMVGQDVQSKTADARAQKTFEDTEVILNDQKRALDALDTRTAGGLEEVLAAIDQLRVDLRGNPTAS
jgi:hypothetical protein